MRYLREDHYVRNVKAAGSIKKCRYFLILQNVDHAGIASVFSMLPIIHDSRYYSHNIEFINLHRYASQQLFSNSYHILKSITKEATYLFCRN